MLILAAKLLIFMMPSYQNSDRVVKGFIGFWGFGLSSFVLHLLMVQSHRNPPSQRFSL